MSSNWPTTIEAAVVLVWTALQCSGQVIADSLGPIPAGPVASASSEVTSDGRHALFSVLDGSEVVMLVDDKIIHTEGLASYNALSLSRGGDPVAFAEGARFAYPHQVGNRWQIVTDRGNGPLFDELQMHLSPLQRHRYILFSPDGSHFAYAGKRNGQWTLVYDGTEGPAFATISAMAFSADSSHFAYGAMGGERWHVMVNGREYASGDLAISNIAFSPNGAHVAWVAGAEGRQDVVMGSLPGKTYSGIIHPPTIADSGRVAYSAWIDDNHCVAVIDGKEFRPSGAAASDPTWEVSWGPYFSSDEKHLAFSMHTGYARGHSWYVVDGKEYPAGLSSRGLALGVSDILFIPSDGVAYLGGIGGGDGQRPEERMFFDGRPDPWCDAIEFPALGPDGKRLAYMARPFDDQRWRMSVDHVLGTAYGSLKGPVFSPDGKHVVYGAEYESGKWRMVVDGIELAQYDLVTETAGGGEVGSLLPEERKFPYAFDAAGALHFMGRANGFLYRVRYDFK